MIMIISRLESDMIFATR